MSRARIATDAAPMAIGPYSQAVLADGWLWCSGQIALDPATGTVVAEGGTDEASVRAQTVRVLANLAAVLAANWRESFVGYNQIEFVMHAPFAGGVAG